MRRFLIPILLTTTLANAGPGLAHGWYPQACCSDKDCWQSVKVTATAGGWRVETSGEIVPYGDHRIKTTPPEGGADFHICHQKGDPKGRVLCLFVPEMGA